MSNYTEAGAIIALVTSLTLWQNAFGFDAALVGVIAAVSANAFGAAQLAWSIGPAIGFALAVLVEPLGVTGSRLIFAPPGPFALFFFAIARGVSAGLGAQAFY